MSHDSLSHQAEEIGTSFTNLLKPVEASAESTCEAIRKEARQLITRGEEKIRANPLPAVAGAFAFGIAVGCLIMSGRHLAASNDSFDLREPLADAGDVLSSSLRAVYDNLKFW